MAGSETFGSTERVLWPGDWWLGITCPRCSELLALVPEDTADAALLPANGRLRTTCPVCRMTFLFAPEYLLRFQIPDENGAPI